MARWLVRVGYDGRDFQGWARQPGVRSVEGEIERGLVRQGIAASAEVARLRVASRTDRGVSARGNALALTSSLHGPPLLRALNGIAPDIFFTAAREVGTGFSPRRALRRWYRYFETQTPPVPGALGRWRRVASQFEGRVDVRSFGRRMDPGKPVWRDVERFHVTEHGGGLLLDLWAPSFVWGMVRKMVTAGRAVVHEELPIDRLRAAIEGRAPRGFALAEPEPLVLWSVDYGENWTNAAPGPTRTQRRRWQKELSRARTRTDLQELVWADFLDPQSDRRRRPD
ncbi:MAG: hypothetical protein L3K23_08375 [Thermoplasmata archaeon]|nr:hypothetical protein [Thermoplasmata archaeon]